MTIAPVPAHAVQISVLAPATSMSKLCLCKYIHQLSCKGRLSWCLIKVAKEQLVEHLIRESCLDFDTGLAELLANTVQDVIKLHDFILVALGFEMIEERLRS